MEEIPEGFLNTPEYRQMSVEEKFHVLKQLERQLDVADAEARIRKAAAAKIAPAEAPAPAAPRPMTRAERERAEIFDDRPYEATMEEIHAMTPSQYKKWVQAGSHQAKEPAPHVPLAEASGEPTPVQPDMATLEGMSDEEYRAWYQKSLE